MNVKFYNKKLNLFHGSVVFGSSFVKTLIIKLQVFQLSQVHRLRLGLYDMLTAV